MNAGSSQQRLAISIAPATGSAEPAVATPALTPSKQLQEVPSANSEEKAAEPATPPSAAKEPASEAPAATANSEKPADKPIAADKPKQAKPGQKLITIAVDAGHGGEDPGARGANGSHEKNITLAIARKLKQQIDAEDNMQAILIRDGDYFVPLGDRVKKARAAKADLFISIHADSFVNSTAKGSSVFALSERGATSAGARYLAKKENAVDLIGGVSLDTRDMDLARTLLDLSQTATIHDSIRMGKAVLGRIAKINTLHSKYVEQAAFAVLKSPDIPSILVETAFISNPDEESRLNDDVYQDKLVNAILSGVKSYVATNPSFAKK
jgi:N-acetylmuramoyl-L-alanine amidase